MGMKEPKVATIAGDNEVDHAIATLVLAFGTDPVARWMYDDRMNICCTYHGYSELLERTRLRQEQRSEPTTALGSRSGYHQVFTGMMGRLRRLLPEV